MSKETANPASRRSVLRAGLSAAVAAGATGARRAAAQEKLDPKMVFYQDHPKDGAKCSLCVQFQPPNACKVVSGTISPEGWCAAFAAKPA